MRITIFIVASLIMATFSEGHTQTPSAGHVESRSQSETHKGSRDKDADNAWKELGTLSESPVPIDGVRSSSEAYKKWGANSPEFKKWSNKLNLRYREQGLKFWREYSNDPRRYYWLKETTWMPPHYWSNWESAALLPDPSLAPMDLEQQKNWDNTYMGLRSEFMNSPSVTDAQRNEFRSSELLMNYWRHKRLALARGEKPDFNLFVPQLLDLAPTANSREVVDIANNILISMADDVAAEASFIQAMKLSPNLKLRTFAAGRERVARLRSVPMDLQVTTLEGEKVDLADLRGKVVLVSIWANSCSFSAALMSEHKPIYEKYQNQGFEILGIWLSLNEAADKPEARRLLKERGVAWSSGVLSGAALTGFLDSYAITGAGITYLLDKKGKLVATNLRGPKLEQEIRLLLSAK